MVKSKDEKKYSPLKGNHSRSGFTLVEVLVALVVLGVGIMSFIGLQVNNVGRNSESKLQSQGYTWAMDQVERLLGLAYTHGDLSVLGNPAIENDGHSVVRAPYAVEWDVVSNDANVNNSRLVHIFIRHGGREVARIDFTRVQSSL